MTPVLAELIRALDAAARVLGESPEPFDKAWGEHFAADAVDMRRLRLSDRWLGEGGQ